MIRKAADAARPAVHQNDSLCRAGSAAGEATVEERRGISARQQGRVHRLDKMMLGSGGDRVDLFYFGRGHTSGDAWVVFPSLRVMHTGDLFANKNLPIVDANAGGSGVERDFLAAVRDAKKAGKSVDDVASSWKTPEKYVGYGMPQPARVKSNAQVIFDELK